MVIRGICDSLLWRIIIVVFAVAPKASTESPIPFLPFVSLVVYLAKPPSLHDINLLANCYCPSPKSSADEPGSILIINSWLLRGHIPSTVSITLSKTWHAGRRLRWRNETWKTSDAVKCAVNEAHSFSPVVLAYCKSDEWMCLLTTL